MFEDINKLNTAKEILEIEEQFQDLTPVRQFTSEVKILQIDYEEYTEVINDYFRAILQTNEISKRSYSLTKRLILDSATNYMAWYHRRQCIDKLELDLEEEIIFVDSITEENQKNYQIWHHRKIIAEKSQIHKYERPIIERIFIEEPKNFHAWCHRIWVVRRFNLYEDHEEEFVDLMISRDIRNNSAWNYRYFLITQAPDNLQRTLEKEIDYALDKITQDIDNESAYNYLRGVFTSKLLNKENKKLSEFKLIEEACCKIVKSNEKCHHALSLLFDYYASLLECSNDDSSKDGITEKITWYLDRLAEVDYIRRKYWLWKKKQFIK